MTMPVDGARKVAELVVIGFGSIFGLRGASGVLPMLLCVFVCGAASALAEDAYVIQPPSASRDARPVLVLQKGSCREVLALSVSPDGKKLAVPLKGWDLRPQGGQGSSDGGAGVVVWDLTRGLVERTLRGHRSRYDDSGIELPPACVTSASFSPRGARLALVSDGWTTVWDTASWQMTAKLYTGAGAVVFSPDGKKVVSSFGIWDVLSGRREKLLVNATEGITDMLSGRTGADVELSPHVILDSEFLLNNPTYGADTIRISPDGTKLAIALSQKLHLKPVVPSSPWSGRCEVVVFDLQSGRTERTFQGRGHGITSMCFSPDGRWLAASSDDQTVAIWDFSSGGAEKILRGHTEATVREDMHPGHSIDTTFYTVNTPPVCFSPDGTMLASGSMGLGEVILWDIQTGRPRRILKTRTDGIISLAFTPDGKKLLSGSVDGSVKVWDLNEVLRREQPREWVTLFHVSTGTVQGWLALTPSGHYTCSVGADSILRWRIGNGIFPFDEFEERFRRPDMVEKALAGEDISKALPLDTTRIPPSIRFVSPKYGAEVAGREAEVEIQASGVYPIERVEVTVNGRPQTLEAARALEIGKPDKTQRTFRLVVPFPNNGLSRMLLRAVAYDTHLSRSRPDELALYTSHWPAIRIRKDEGTLRVLSVGIDRYRNAGVPALQYAAADAKALAEAFSKQSGRESRAKAVAKVLTDSEATLSSLKFALRELKDRTFEWDTVVIFISGHSVRDKKGDFYFGSCDLDPQNVAMTALNWKDFANTLREVRAKRVLVLADTCHAGGIIGDQSAGNDILAYLVNREAHRLVFVSSDSNEVSLAKEGWGHGAFTKALLEALAGAADVGEKDGNITFRELRDYVPKRVEELTEGRQHPQLPFLDNYEPDAVLASVG
jgi:WD40 repeat protein